tara:strand:- start:324 stop:632 length:309 start_codon:yes stop_codon:yes gene_type:complete
MELKNQVITIAKQLENPDLIDWVDENEQSAFDYLHDALDIQYIVDSKKEYLGARILVTFGGPNIWINTQYNKVEGYWGTDTEIWSYKDELGIDGACRDLFDC